MVGLRAFWTLLRARAWFIYELCAKFVHALYCTCMQKTMFFYKQFERFSTWFWYIPAMVGLRAFWTLLRDLAWFIYELCAEFVHAL